MKRSTLAILTALGLFGCQEAASPTRSQSEFEKFVGEKPIGYATNYWLQMLQLDGTWGNVALVFGYYEEGGSFTECQHMTVELTRVNFARKYRCVPANKMAAYR